MHFVISTLQVSYLPRELLEQQVAAPPRLRTLSGVNAPPPPIQRTPSRDGIHRAPAPAGVRALCSSARTRAAVLQRLDYD